MTRISWIKLVLLFTIVTGVRCLRDARLEVMPEIVERGNEAVLRCHYVLEDIPLYSVKWYRGKHEFYRYSPNVKPNTKTFPVPGIDIDLTKSNENQVTIRNVGIDVTGNFSCEVTADAPTFETEVGWKKLTVVSLPAGSPVIAAERERYDPGDTLKANCTVLPSEPPAVVSFTLNNQPVGTKRMSQSQHKSNHNVNEGLALPSSYNVPREGQKKPEHAYGNLQWNELTLDLQPFHYVNGQLNLRCIVQIPEIYNATSEPLQLGAGLREPVPERVTSENSSGIAPTSFFSLTFLSVGFSHALLR